MSDTCDFHIFLHIRSTYIHFFIYFYFFTREICLTCECECHVRNERHGRRSRVADRYLCVNNMSDKCDFYFFCMLVNQIKMYDLYFEISLACVGQIFVSFTSCICQ